MTDNSQSTCDIVDLIHDGRGVGRPQGKTCFIQGALPGEKVVFRRHKQKRNYDEAHVVEILSPSENRIEPRCKHFPRCGGCTLQHFDHRAQVTLKQKQLLDSLQRSGMAPPTLLPPLTASPGPIVVVPGWHCREPKMAMCWWASTIPAPVELSLLQSAMY